MRVEDVGSVLDDRAAYLERLIDVDMKLQRRVLAVAQLDDARHPHEVDPGAKIEAADDRRAGQDQHRQVTVALDERVRDRAAAAQMAEAEAVVTIDQKTTAFLHDPAGGVPRPPQYGRSPARGKRAIGPDGAPI